MAVESFSICYPEKNAIRTAIKFQDDGRKSGARAQLIN